MPRKWIAKRMKQLDPETDYDEIWKLSTAYRPNDFVMNLIYTVTFPHFFITQHGAEPLVDGGSGKIIKNADQRVDDTSWKMQTWFHYGSTHERTKKNVESINKLHEFYAKKYPGNFNHNEDYIYTLCYEAAGMHRLMQRIGLPGLSEKEQKASVKFWSNMARLFRNPETGENFDFPSTFAGILEYMYNYEKKSIESPSHDAGNVAMRAILDQFANRYFPKFLHGFAHAWIISLYPDHIITFYKLKRPPSLFLKAFRFGTKAMFWFGEKVAPDPTTTFIERRDMKLGRNSGTGSMKTPHSTEPTSLNDSGIGGCPYHQQIKQSHTETQKPMVP